jgi:hypothetical protein
LLFLRIKKGKKRQRADGSAWAEATVIERSRKFGPVLHEDWISVKHPLLITGPHDAGKTRWLERLRENALAIWGTKAKADPLWLAATRPLSAWSDLPHLAQWWGQRPHEAQPPPGLPLRKGEVLPPLPWHKLKAWERVDALPLYCEETGAVLFIDDAHKLEGRKLDVARRCLLVSRLWVMSAADEGRIPPSLRAVTLNRDPRIFRLGSEVAYDVTPIAMWFLIVLAVGLGMYEIAGVLGGLKLMGSGRLAARQT